MNSENSESGTSDDWGGEEEKIEGLRSTLARPAYYRDPFIYRAALFVVSSIAIISLVAEVYLQVEFNRSSEVLSTILGTSVGCLVGLFVPR